MAKKILLAFLFVIFSFSLGPDCCAWDFDSYRDQSYSFGGRSYNFSDFNKELNFQKQRFSASYNVYKNYRDSNVSRNLFGFDLTDSLSTAANFKLSSSKQAVQSPQLDVSRIDSKFYETFYAADTIKNSEGLNVESLDGAELFLEKFGSSEPEENIPQWFESGKSIFEPTKPEQVGGRDVEEVKQEIHQRNIALGYTGAIESVLESQTVPELLTDDKSKITDVTPQQLQTTAQNLEEELAQIIPITPLPVKKPDPAIMPGESWEKIRQSLGEAGEIGEIKIESPITDTLSQPPIAKTSLFKNIINLIKGPISTSIKSVWRTFWKVTGMLLAPFRPLFNKEFRTREYTAEEKQPLTDFEEINITPTEEGYRCELDGEDGMVTIEANEKVSFEIDSKGNLDKSQFADYLDEHNIIISKEGRPIGVILKDGVEKDQLSEGLKKVLNERSVEFVMNAADFKQLNSKNTVIFLENGLLNSNSRKSNEIPPLQGKLKERMNNKGFENVNVITLYHADNYGFPEDSPDWVRLPRDLLMVVNEMLTPIPEERAKVENETVEYITSLRREGKLGPAVSVIHMPHSGGGQPVAEAVNLMPYKNNYVVFIDTPLNEPKLENTKYAVFVRSSWIGDITPTMPENVETYEIDSSFKGDHHAFFKDKQAQDYVLQQIYNHSYEFRLDELIFNPR